MSFAQRTLIAWILAAAAPSHAEGGANLDWLLGCWQNEDGSAQEVWVKEADGSLLGFAVVIAEGGVTFYELLSIAQRDDGVLTYTAHPEGQSRTAFAIAEIGVRDVLFRNPDHDFPQEIAYRLEGGALTATISLMYGERPRAFLKRRCD